MAKSHTEDYKRLVAYDDFKNLDPSRRNVEALWDSYVQRNQDGEDVPTTTRPTLYRWAKEDNWRGRLAVEEAERQESDKLVLLKNRRRQLAKFGSMLETANEALLAIIREAGDEATRLRAIIALYDRTGYTAMTRTAASQREINEASDDTLPVQVPTRPADDASAEDWAQYTREMREAAR